MSNCNISSTVQQRESTGTMIASGLTTGGLLTKVTLNALTWTALPPTALPGRNALSIQNTSAIQIVLDYVNTNPAYEGVIVNSGNERFYSITDQIIMYAKAQSGTPTIMIEELA